VSNQIEGYRLSPIQRRLWMLMASDPEKNYEVVIQVLVAGKPNWESLRHAASAVIQRHEALRTSLHLLPGISVPLQVISGDFDETKVELDGAEIPAQAAGADQALRFRVIHVDEDHHDLRMSAPAVLLDIQSLQLVAQELLQAYSAFDGGGVPSFGSVLQYVDIAEWLNELAEAKEAVTGRKYWKQVGSRANESSYTPNAAICKAPGPQTLVIDLNPEVGNKIVAGEASGKWQTADFVLAAWTAVLVRLGYAANCIGVSFDGRSDERFQTAVGLLAEYLPIIVQPTQSPFVDFVEQTGAMLRRAAKWQEYFKWEDIESQIGAGSGFSSFTFCFDHLDVAQLRESASVSFAIDGVSGNWDQFGMRLSSKVQGGRLRLEFSWASSICSGQEAVTIAAGLSAFLSHAIEQPEIPASDISIIDEPTRIKLLRESNRTTVDFADIPSIHLQFSQQADRTPDAVAVLYGDKKLTYEQLNADTEEFAHILRSRGVGPESLVGIYMERSVEMVVALLAVLKANAAYVPLDPAYPSSRLQQMITSSGTRLVISSHATFKMLGYIGVDVIDIEDLHAEAIGDEKPAVVDVFPEQPAYVIYTSGSTGEPKGVVVTHAGIRNHMAWMQRVFSFGASDRFLQKTAFSFDASVWEFYAPLLIGGTLVMAMPGGQQDAEYLVNCIQEFKITILQLVPTQLRMVLEQHRLEECRSIRRVYCGGEALPQELVTEFYHRLPWAELYNLYGPTEATIDATYARCGKESETGTSPIGVPVANTQVYVLDPAMQLMPAGVKGELYIGGAGLARGYLNRPELTADRFVPNPFAATGGERLYKTGDQVRWTSEGTLEFFGRFDHQVKIRGYRIELEEIEAALLQITGIKQATVIVREDVPGNQSLVGYVVLDNKAIRPAEKELKARLESRLPEYMVPASVVSLEKMPLTPNGKIDRKALPKPDQGSDVGLLPRDEVELQLANIWQDLLKVSRVGRQQNFFELGGHSLLAITLMKRIREQFELNMPLSALFDQPTIEHLADVLRSRYRPPVRSHLVEIRPQGPKRPLFFVHPSGGSSMDYIPLAYLLGPDQPFYGISAIDEEENVISPFPSIEERAARYIAAIQNVQPHGPYLLGGWSFGGYVAYEMAQQLQRRDEEVASLLMLDVRAEISNNVSAIPDDDADFLLQFARNNGLRLAADNKDFAQSLAQFSVQPGDRSTPEERLRDLVTQIVRAGGLPAEIEISQVANYIQGIRKREQSLSRYTPEPYTGEITLIRAVGGGLSPDELQGEDAALGWRRLAGEVQVYGAPGMHSNMVYPPHVEKLAETIRQCLKSADAPSAVLTKPAVTYTRS
jgi:amino acid adenylation domain-containing protein